MASNDNNVEVLHSAISATATSDTLILSPKYNLDISYNNNEALVSGDDILIKVQYQASSGDWITFKRWDLDETNVNTTGVLELGGSYNVPRGNRGYTHIRAVATYTVASGTHRLTVAVNYANPDEDRLS